MTLIARDKVRLLDRSAKPVGIVLKVGRGRPLRPYLVQIVPRNPRSEFWFSADELEVVR